MDEPPLDTRNVGRGSRARHSRSADPTPPVSSRLHARKQPVQRRSEAMVDFIIEAAIRILDTRGAAALTTTAVARTAGISVGSLYQYFPNREAILAAVVARYMDDVRAAVLGAPIPEGAPLDAAVRAIIADLVALKRRTVRVSLALSPLVHALEARTITVAGTRALAGELAAKLAPHLGRPLEAEDETRVRLAVAAVEGALAEIWTVDATAIEDPAVPDVLAGIVLNALAR